MLSTLNDIITLPSYCRMSSEDRVESPINDDPFAVAMAAGPPEKSLANIWDDPMIKKEQRVDTNGKVVWKW